MVEVKWPDRVGSKIPAAVLGISKRLHRGKVVSHRARDRDSIVRRKAGEYQPIFKIDSRHPRHDRIAPAEGRGRVVDQVRPWNRNRGLMMKFGSIISLGRKLRRGMHSAAKHELTFGARHENILPEESKQNRLGTHELAEIEMIQRSL